MMQKAASSGLRRVSAPVADVVEVTLPGARRAREAAGGTQLRICLVSETLITGVGRHVADIATAMAARGHHVHLFHSSLRFEQRLADELDASSGVTRVPLPMRIRPHWSDMSVLTRLKQHLRRAGPFDVIHGHSSKGGAYARLLGLGSKAKVFYSAHAFITLKPDLSPAERLFYGAIERSLGRVTDHVICVSQVELEHARLLGIGLDNILTIPNGLADTVGAGPRVDLRRRLGLPADTVLIGFVGRMDAQKAPNRLIDASFHVLRRRQGIHFVMLGDGPLRPELEHRVERLGNGAHFTWAGNQRGVDWIPGFDILAMPSRYEGFSYVMLEALRAGVPLVCTPVSGALEMVIDGIEGFVVPHGDDNALAARLITLADQPALRRQMGELGRRATAPFTIDNMIERLEAAYLTAHA